MYIRNAVSLAAVSEDTCTMPGSYGLHSFDLHLKAFDPKRVTAQPATVITLMLPYCGLSGLSAAYRFQMHAWKNGQHYPVGTGNISVV